MHFNKPLNSNVNDDERLKNGFGINEYTLIKVNI